MAMATNASAGVIYFDQAVTVGPVANATVNNTAGANNSILLKSANGGNIGFSFRLGVFQSFPPSGNRSGSAFLTDSSVLWLVTESSLKLKKLPFGAHISTVPGAGAGWGRGHIDLASQTTSAGLLNEHGWAANATGLAGFRFSTTNGALDYGWVRLSYTLGTNGFANSITATDWGYDPNGDPVTAGEGASSATPEPSTMALAILAAGAAGVAALRRRRQAAV